MASVHWRGDMRTVRPMLATLEDAPLQRKGLIYEPKYDGIRALVEINPAQRPPVRLWSRLGNDKTAQFPDLAAALTSFSRELKKAIVLDGEIVALDEHGEPAGFQRLQNRIHLTAPDTRTAAGRVAFIAFDILRDGDEDVRPLPLTERRARLDRVFRNPGSPILRRSEVVADDGRELHRQALERGWEGLIVKDASSVYHSGKRTRDWRKLKIVQEQEFIVGGWTEARTTGRPFGALLVGYYDNGTLKYAGHSGGGFDQRELDRLIRLLKPLEIPTSPFSIRPRTNERPHWTRPVLVVQLKFTEWTDDGLLRHPIYLGLRDDVVPETVKREKKARTTTGALGALGARGALGALGASGASGARGATRARGAVGARSATGARTRAGRATRSGSADVQSLVDQLDEIERSGKDGTLRLPGGQVLGVTNLRKVFWPKLKLTKGDLMRYYARVSPALLPVVADRPLIMKRYPNGIDGQPFYQHNAPDKVPTGVRIEKVPGDSVVSRPIGGNLITLLYMTQLAAISQDPWFSRVKSPHMADQCAIDLDPMPGVKFEAVLDVARWIRDELAALKVPAFAKTSGARGIHVFIPLRAGTPYQSGQIFCEIIATMVAEKHPKVATVTRAVRARGQKVYVDYLQNIEGKSLACAYSARASEFAGASTPLTWKEVDEGVDPRDFTILTLPDRLAEVGDLWKPLVQAKGIDLRTILK